MNEKHYFIGNIGKSEADILGKKYFYLILNVDLKNGKVIVYSSPIQARHNRIITAEIIWEKF